MDKRKLYTLIVEIPIEEFLPLIGKKYAIKLFGVSFGTNSHRLLTFQNSLECVWCGIHATHVRIMGNRNNGKIQVWSKNEITDMYTLMTSDHIIPTAKGGSNGMDNRQTMCKPCNERKSAHTWMADKKDELLQRVLEIKEVEKERKRLKNLFWLRKINYKSLFHDRTNTKEMFGCKIELAKACANLHYALMGGDREHFRLITENLIPLMLRNK